MVMLPFHSPHSLQMKWKCQAILRDSRQSPFSFFGAINSQLRLFPYPAETVDADIETREPDDKPNFAPSVALKPQFNLKWGDSGQEAKGELFFRYDMEDSQRTQFDIRELYVFFPISQFEFSLGVKQIFWGVVESVNVANFINQKDYMEDPVGQQKLGQSMFHTKIFVSDLTLSLMILPQFREMDFPDSSSYFAPPLPVLTDQSKFESKDGKNTLELAARINYPISNFDLNLIYFDGINRSPRLDIVAQSFTDFVIEPYYFDVTLIGGYGELAIKEFLFKVEAVQAKTSFADEMLSVYGTEYNLSSIAGISTISFAFEYLDQVEIDPNLSPFNDSIFFGANFIFEDDANSNLVVSHLHNDKAQSSGTFLEFSRRLAENFRFTASAVLLDIRQETPNAVFARDDFVQLDLDWHF